MYVCMYVYIYIYIHNYTYCTYTAYTLYDYILVNISIVISVLTTFILQFVFLS